jgi:hypothetical protein
VYKAEHVVHEAAVLGGVRGLTEEFVDPRDGHDEMFQV